jgi:hypothetical protein
MCTAVITVVIADTVVGADLRVGPLGRVGPVPEGAHAGHQGAHAGAPLRTVIRWFKTMTTNESINRVIAVL